jgi:PhnB protein
VQNPYLHFNGQCEEAFNFYARCLGGKVEGLFQFGSSPAASQVPEAWRSKVMHASLKFDDQVLMGTDAPPDRYQKPQGFSVSLSIKDPAMAERVFGELSQNGTVTMPMQETFWATRFGMCVDRFGIPWMVNCEKTA